MRIIDAHIHFYNQEGFNRLARNAGHENTGEHLRSRYREKNIVHAVVMGNRSLALEEHHYPDFMSYCIGLDRFVLGNENPQSALDLVERHLQRRECVGIKLYPGYNPQYVYDKAYFPYYELAQHYHKPVAIHTGSTASGMGILKYCHPLTIDEVASLYPHVQFVMCHFGNPFVTEAAAVLGNKPNVAADLSGMLEGQLNMPEFSREYHHYIEHLKTWIQYLGDYDRLMYGTDWPLINIQNYIDFVSMLIPDRHLEKVFFDNANRIYQLGLAE